MIEASLWLSSRAQRDPGFQRVLMSFLSRALAHGEANFLVNAARLPFVLTLTAYQPIPNGSLIHFRKQVASTYAQLFYITTSQSI